MGKTQKMSDQAGNDTELGRRAFVRKAAVGMAGVGALAAVPGMATPAAAATGELVDAGVGMYANLTTASQVSTATISAERVTCGVGTVGLDTSTVTPLIPALGQFASTLPLLGGSTGPFAMLMYSTRMETYDVDRAGATLRATGRMRSITQMGGMTLEDVEHDFLGIAKSGGGKRPDYFAVHFTTPFWKAGSNPLATPSPEVDGWSLFGGELLLGAIVVAP